MKSGLFKKIIGQIYIWVILLFMYAPILVLVAYSFSTTEIIGKGFIFSFDLYKNLFNMSNSTSRDIMIALGNTLLIAVISAAISTFLGTLGAIGAFYSKSKVRKTIDSLTQIPVVNAEIVVAFSLTVMFVFLGQYVFRQDLFGFWTLVIGHVCLSLPFVYISVKPKLEQMDPSLYEAAIDLGASPSQALRKVIIPEILPGVLSGFLLSMTLSLDDFIITSFTRGPGLLSGENKIETISTFVQGAIKKKNVPPEMRALTTIIFLVVVAAVIIISVRNYRASTQVKKRRGRIANV